MNLSRLGIASVLVLTIATMLLISAGWEFWLEEAVSEALGLHYDGQFEEEERWRFILTSTSFAALSLLVPGLLLLMMFGRLERAYAAIVDAQKLADSLARHDALTGLPNRRVLAADLQRALRRSEEKGEECAVLLIDLDRFKIANDVHGHRAGDIVLCEVARRLRALVPEGGTLARHGGDEFAMVVVGSDQQDSLMRLARRIIARVSAPFPVDDASVEVGASIGIARYSPQNANPEAMLRGADIAMYRAKRDGGGTFRFFEERMDRELREKARLEGDLRGAVLRDEIRPFFQPIVSLPDRAVLGFEILARWPHPQGDIPPDVFIPIAEDSGLINDLTCRLLKLACRDAARWPPSLVLALNVSPGQLIDRWLPERVLGILTETGFPARRLEIEVTENTSITDMESAQATIASLHNIGVRFALDDFGTGHSSLSNLQRLRFDKIKIDRSFVQAMSTDEDSRKLVLAMIRLGRSLGLETTAEGVEQERDANWLAEQGCTSGQGFLFGRPMQAADAACLLGRDATGGGDARPALAS